jgi:hypothetical protein
MLGYFKIVFCEKKCMNLKVSIDRLKRQGYSLEVVGDSLRVSPSSALNRPQLDYLKRHKAKIIKALNDERKEQRVIAWLSSMGETDQEIINDTLSRCQADHETMQYFLMRSMEAGL